MGRQLPAVLIALLVVIYGLIVGPIPDTHAQLEDLVAAARPAVVVVLAAKATGKAGHGSGFIFHPSGFILTNQHVVEGATEISVLLSDRRRLPATVVDYIRRVEFSCPVRVDSVVDAAVLKIEGEGFPTLQLGDSDTLRQGQEIIVMGFPGGVGIDQVSVTRGIVGAVRGSWLQTDAVMLPGNSGGPVMERGGKVVGLATFGTGPGLRIGGIVAINGIRAMVTAATTPGAARAQEFRVTGQEYAGPMVVGRRRTYRSTYSGPSEVSREISQITNLAGGLLYTLRRSDGGEGRNMLGADGLFQLAALSSSGWRTTFPEPYGLLLFPPCPGVAWRTLARAEQASSRSVRQIEIQSRIEAVGETATVPAGTFQQVLRLAETWSGTETQGNRTQSFRTMYTEWWAPGVGLIRSVEEAQGGGRASEELTSHFTPPPP